jgi:uncharacterized RDD family membrane protein YckC
MGQCEDTRVAYEPYRDPTAVMARRIVAYIIDYVLIGIIGFIVVNATIDTYDVGDIRRPCDAFEETEGDVAACFESDDETIAVIEDTSDFAILAMPLLAVLANAVILQGATGATVGKHIVGLRVVDRNGSICGYGRALVRSVLLIVDAAVCFLIGLVTALASRGHRRVGDMVANTYVVGQADVGSPPVPTLAYGVPSSGTPPSGWTPPTSAPPAPGWTPPSAPGEPPSPPSAPPPTES